MATSEAGAADASLVGRETIVTLMSRGKGAAVGKKQPRREEVHGWELGWTCFERPGLVAVAVAGRSVKPPVKPSCVVVP